LDQKVKNHETQITTTNGTVTQLDQKVKNHETQITTK